MEEETLALSDAPEPEVTEKVTEVEELKGETPSESSPEPEDKLEEKPKTDSVQKRIDELTRKRRETERDRDYWREQAMKKEPETPETPTEKPLKTLQDFDYDEAKYQQHLFEQARNNSVEEAKRVLKEEQAQQQSARKLAEFRAKEAEFAKNVDDYHEAVSNRDLAFSQAMVDITNDMDDGPEVRYHLAKNPDLSYEIANMPPLAAARELGRIEAKLQAQEKKGETVSKAPAPPAKIAAATPATSKSVDEMTQKEFNAHRRKIIANRG